MKWTKFKLELTSSQNRPEHEVVASLAVVVEVAEAVVVAGVVTAATAVDVASVCGWIQSTTYAQHSWNSIINLYNNVQEYCEKWQ